MIDLSNILEVKALQASLRTKPITEQENMKFLEQLCGWFDVGDIEPNIVLNKNGKRQILATLKTLLDCSPEQVVALNNV